MELHTLAGAHMIDRQLLGMQGLARKAFKGRMGAETSLGAWPFVAVDFVADQRKTHVGEMDPQLMSATGTWQQTHETHRAA